MDFIESYIENLNYNATRWYFITSCIALALLIYYLENRSVKQNREGIFKYLFPSRIYLHQSTKTDLQYLLILPVALMFIFLPATSFLMSIVSEVKYITGLSLAYLFGPVEQTQEIIGIAGAASLILFTLLFAMAADLGFYLHHIAFHKFPFLWEFHKVHHSAEVLTPLTDYRAHPIELLTITMATALMLGLAQGIFDYITSSKLSVVTLAGMNVIFFLYYLCGYSLRHSHIWISYGPFFSKIFISPAQHQIHHSCAEKHWDKNFGGAFALWDWLFGTLYVPNSKEELTYGIGKETPIFRSPLQLYIRPFKMNFVASRSRCLVTAALVFTILLFAGINLI